MQLENFLEKKKQEIVGKWFDTIAESYPADAARFIKNKDDNFANPVGSLTRQSVEAVFDEMVKGFDIETMKSFLDPVIRIRAIQSFSPSNSVSFIFKLKSVIRTCLKSELKDENIKEEMILFEQQIDNLALLAFSLYVACREKLFEIKATEEKKRTFSAFERAGLIRELPEEGVSISEKI